MKFRLALGGYGTIHESFDCPTIRRSKRRVVVITRAAPPYMLCKICGGKR